MTNLHVFFWGEGLGFDFCKLGVHLVAMERVHSEKGYRMQSNNISCFSPQSINFLELSLSLCIFSSWGEGEYPRFSRSQDPNLYEDSS